MQSTSKSWSARFKSQFWWDAFHHRLRPRALLGALLVVSGTASVFILKLDGIRNRQLELLIVIILYLSIAATILSRRGRAGPAKFQPRWTLAGQVFAFAVAAEVGVTVANVAAYPDDYLFFHRSRRSQLERVFHSSKRYSQFEAFFERCRRELPAEARILYHGRMEGTLLAYELYPRPVFMLPAEQHQAWLGHQLLDTGRLPDDPIFPHGFPPPQPNIGRETFIRQHRITHEVTFVEGDLAASRIESVR